MKVLIIGRTGMLGAALYNYFLNLESVSVYSLSRKDFNISDISCLDSNSSQLNNILDRINPNIVINCAAVVNLNECETFPLKTKIVNTQFPNMLASWSKSKKAKLIHISTDHFYYETNSKPNILHREAETCSLANNYAKQKYKAEKQIIQTDESALIIRTNIIGCRHNSNKRTFLEWACNELLQNRILNGFTDYYTTPIYVYDLADILHNLIKWNCSGLYNIASNMAINKYDCLVYLKSLLNSKSHINREVTDQRIKRSLRNGLSTEKIQCTYKSYNKEWQAIDPFDTIRRAVLEFKKSSF